MTPNDNTHDPHQTHGSLHQKLIILVGVVVCLILASCFFYIRYRASVSRDIFSPLSSLNYRHLRISYAELLKATHGFSSSHLIGVGSYGSVYKGVLSDNGRFVAVKVLNLRQHGAPKSFIAECNSLKDNQGRKRDLNLIQRLNVAIDVASALDYLHNHCKPPIVHRDLKPSNVLIADDMSARVGDFGLAKFLLSNSLDQNQSSSMAIKGTIGYIAPEYAMYGQASVKGDVYSYGIMLLEMFIGKKPTDGMFKEGLNLHNFVKMHLPDQVMMIIDPRQVNGELYVEVLNYAGTLQKARGRVHECLVSVLEIGVACSAESSGKRMNMKDIVFELNVIKDVLLGIGIHEKRLMINQLSKCNVECIV
ncbi:hypothetical protein GIB67_027903 [Kingdonia uniflora]|uniref:non-specific serine/threonine protein kinase n=1 Tax=Kingdonia uniflora TaxID=39325 RepID=A0A7J7LGG2_9MAGN|nr:hypothetical protein GIB67_027903 [Kingdonia uniflora]